MCATDLLKKETSMTVASWKKNIHFVLLDTLEPGNIGAAARALKNLGFSNLHLVRPRKYPSQEVGWFAHGAEDVLERATVHEDVGPCLEGCSIVVGTTRRIGKKRGRVLPVREAAQKIRDYARKNRVAILFGREDRGLMNEDAARCSLMLTIPADPKNPSFNLAQAVLIVAHEIFSSESRGGALRRIISDDEFNRLFGRLTDLMGSMGYQPRGIRDSKDGILRDLRRILARTELNPREARMLHGIISQMEEAQGKRT